MNSVLGPLTCSPRLVSVVNLVLDYLAGSNIWTTAYQSSSTVEKGQ